MEKIPLHAYMQSLACFSDQYQSAVQASSTPDDDRISTDHCAGKNQEQLLDQYLRNGIALSNTYCTRWFERLNSLQRNIQYQQANFNIIKDLGTALIGVGSLHSDVTAVYGALGVAGDGWITNLNDVLFLAPEPATVEKRVAEAMLERKQQLLGSQKPKNFLEAYDALGKYAHLCSFHSARSLVQESIEKVKGDTNPGTGSITAKLAPEALAAATINKTFLTLSDRRQAIYKKIDALSSAQLASLYKNLPVKAPSNFDASNINTTSDVGKRAYLKQLLLFLGSEEAVVTAYENALDSL